MYLKINKGIDIFGKVYKEIATGYVDVVDPEKFMRAGIDGMLETLDPYTVYMDETEGDEIELASSADRKQLFFLGGRQAEITKQFENFGVKPNHDLVDLGNMMALTYLAKKDHAGDTEETPYTHLFGEEGGIVPRASYDTLNQRVLVSGGTSHLDDAQAGIRN